MPKLTSGFGLVEVLVGAAIMSIVLFGVMAVFQSSVRISQINVSKTQASFLAEEAVEVVRILRDVAWTSNISALTEGTPYYLEFIGGTWNTTITPSLIDNEFTRTVTFDDVYRDENDDIATSGTLDDGTRKITVDVTWGSGVRAGAVQVVTYISDLFSN